jgi:hypothetical protein
VCCPQEGVYYRKKDSTIVHWRKVS